MLASWRSGGRFIVLAAMGAGACLSACSAVSGEAGGGRLASEGDGKGVYDGDYYGDPGYAGTGGSASPSGASEWYEQVGVDGQFEAVGTNPFVITAHEPRSTFAADVDTASYDIFRSSVEGGRLPDPASVRLEEFVNYFSYDYEAPEAEAAHPFRIHLDASPSLASRGTQLLRVGIQGKLPPSTESKAANLVYLVDVSGSMQPVFPLVQHTLKSSLEVLAPSDFVSIVTYAGSTQVALPPTPVAERGKIEYVIDGLMSGGSTNGASGIHLAYEQAQTAFIEGGINHVVLCTDGDFNVGVTSTEDLVELIEDKRRTGITLTVLGYGHYRVNDAMMERVSNAGNGIYGYIGSEVMADEYVAERLLSSLHLIAKDVKLQVEFNPEHVFAYRLLGYENRLLQHDQFRLDVVDAGEIGAGHRVTALYELIPVGGELPQGENLPAALNGDPYAGAWEVDPADLVLVKVRYKDVDASEEDSAYEVSQSLSPEAVATGYAAASSDLQWASAVAAFAEILKQSPYADPQSLDAITVIVDSQKERDARRGRFSELFSKAQQLLSNAGH